MDLQDQLKKLFPDHKPEDPKPETPKPQVWMQDAPILCRYEKRHGKPVTVLEGYTGANEDFTRLSRQIKRELGVGGSFKNEQIIIQGDYRDRIMKLLSEMGFTVKRVGG